MTLATSARAVSVELELDCVRSLVAPALAGRDIASISEVDGGLVNRTYRVGVAGSHDAFGVRIYSSGVETLDKELDLLTRVASSVPVPEVVLAAKPSERFLYPVLVYRWVDGVTLNECRRTSSPTTMDDLGEQLGQLVANVAGVSADGRVRPLSTSDALAVAVERLRNGLARSRLGDRLADAVRRLFAAAADRLAAADRAHGLAHGDFGGRNIIVVPAENERWRIVALLDWEQAFAGATLWDVGSLFRYTERYSDRFRERFERGYRDAGGALARDWYRTARLLDATRVVAILDEDRDLPTVFAECRDLVAALVTEE